MTTEAQRKAIQKYRSKSKRFTVEFSEADEALWKQVEKQPNKQGYIKSLIRADMEKREA